MLINTLNIFNNKLVSNTNNPQTSKIDQLFDKVKKKVKVEQSNQNK